MTNHVDTFESYTAGVAVPTGSFWDVNLQPVLASDVDPFEGAKHAQIANPGVATFILRKNNETTGPLLIETRFKFVGLPNAQIWISQMLNGANTMRVRCSTLSSNVLRVESGASGATRWTGAVPLVSNEYRMLRLWADPGADTTTGKLRVALLSADGQTVLEDSGLIEGINVGAGDGAPALARGQIGKLNNTDYTGTLRFDSFKMSTGADAVWPSAPEPEPEPEPEPVESPWRIRRGGVAVPLGDLHVR